MMTRLLALALAVLTGASPAVAGSPFIWGADSRAQGLQSSGLFFSNRQTVDYNGAINYIGNQSAVDTTGWTTYADAAQSTPVDCTGGSPNTTWTTTTSSPQRGSSNFVLTHNSGASRQGEGVAYAFTTDNQDSAFSPRALTLSANIYINDTDYTNGDLAFYVYDVTNSTLITPSVTQITGAPYTFVATFVTTTSTSYRLCVHTAGTGTGAWVANFDNFYVGPSNVIQGLPVYTQDISSNLSFPSGWNTPTLISAYLTRYGEKAFIQASWQNGSSVSANSAQIDIGNIGINIDSSKYTSQTNRTKIGTWTAIRASTSQPISDNSGDLFYDGSDTDSIFLGFTVGSSARQYLKVNVNDIFQNSSSATIETSFYVSQWAGSSSYFGFGYPEYAYNTSTSDANDTTSFGYGPGGNLVPTITSGSFSSSRDKRVRFLTPIQTTDKFVVQIQDSGVGNWVDVGESTAYSSYNLQNNHAYGVGYKAVSGSTTDVDVSFFRGGLRPNGATFDSNGQSYPNNAADRWRIVKIPGQVQVATPANAVNARAHASSTSLSGSLATIVWTTEDFDSTNSLDGSTGIFTCPIPGKYQVNTALALSGTFALNNTSIIEIQKNSSAQANVTEYSAAAVTNEHISASDIVSCVTGDTIRIQASSGATGPGIVSSNTKNYLSIVRVGD